MYSEERGRKVDKKVEKTRPDVRRRRGMQLKMCNRSFKKNWPIFSATKFTLLVSIY